MTGDMDCRDLDCVIELLEEADRSASASVSALYYVAITVEGVRRLRRIDLLRDAGLLEKSLGDESLYQITDSGCAFLKATREPGARERLESMLDAGVSLGCVVASLSDSSQAAVQGTVYDFDR